MNIRQIIVRGMLISLALAACAGVLGILVPGRDTVWRVVWTAAATGIACGLILAATRFIEKPQMQPSAYFASALILVEFLLTVGLIWDVPRMLGISRSSDSWGITMGLLLLGGVGGTACMRLLPQQAMRIASFAGLGIAAVGTVTSLVGTWSRSLSSGRQGDLIGIGIAILGAGVPIVLSLLGAGVDRRLWRWFGVLASALAAALITYGIWNNTDPGKPVVLALIVSVAVVVAHANASMLAALSAGQRWLRMATIAAVAVTGALISAMVYDRAESDLLSRLSAASGICAACGTIAIAILARANRRSERPDAAEGLVQMVVICPRCNKKQAVPLGDSQCQSCGLRYSIKVEEPRCPTCDYLLYGLVSDRCPECGTVIRQDVAPA
jgi:hypothetical protein